MSDIFDDMFDESTALSKVDTEAGANLSTLVRTLRKVEEEIALQEDALKQLTAQKQRLTMELIPGLMDEMGIERVDVDGVTVQRKVIVSASIPAARKTEAFEWLRTHHLDDIIKNDVVISFGKGQDNLAADTVGMLKDRGLAPEQKTHIHPSTLKAFVRERLESGQPLDLDLFGAFIVNAAEIRRK